MNAKFEQSEALKTEIEEAPWRRSDIVTKINAGQFARFDTVNIEILNGSLVVTLGFEDAVLGSYTFKRNLLDEYKIDGLFAHVKVGE